jgi:hypothetical protein
LEGVTSDGSSSGAAVAEDGLGELAREVGVFDSGGVFRAETSVHAEAGLAVSDWGSAVVSGPAEVAGADCGGLVSAGSVPIAISGGVASRVRESMDGKELREEHGVSRQSSDLNGKSSGNVFTNVESNNATNS